MVVCRCVCHGEGGGAVVVFVVMCLSGGTQVVLVVMYLREGPLVDVDVIEKG